MSAAPEEEYRVSPEGTKWLPSTRQNERGSAADWDNAKRWFTDRSVDEWVGLFDRAPHILHSILGDLYRETKAEREREEGRARIGRRPKAIDGNLEELWGMISPRYSMEPFAESLKDLIGKRSLRAFAARVPIHHHTLTRLMRGEGSLDRFRLEAIAKAGRVHPAYFKEWREQYVLDAISALLSAKPNLSIRVHKEMQRGKR